MKIQVSLKIPPFEIPKQHKDWVFNFLGIPIETPIEPLTKQQMANLIGLAIYEGWIDKQEFCNPKAKNIGDFQVTA